MAAGRYSRRQSSVHSVSSSDDDDAITPCPLEPPTSKKVPQKAAAATSPAAGQEPCSHRRSSSWREHQPHVEPADAEHDAIEPELLWRRMLTVQRMFGCYNSARMSAAIEMGADGTFVPTQTCLDLLNDSIGLLPEEARNQVLDYLGGRASRRQSWDAWKHRFHVPGVTSA